MKIIVSNRLSDLTGIGIEYLQDAQGNIIAMFFDGNMGTDSVPKGNEEQTLKAA